MITFVLIVTFILSVVFWISAHPSKFPPGLSCQSSYCVYNISADKIADMHSAWKTIMTHLGNPNVQFISWDPLHFSNGNQSHI